MPRKDPPQPLSAQTNSANNNIGRGPQSATSLKSPTSPRPFFGKSHSKSSENIHHHKQGSGNVPQLPYPETSMMPKSVDVEMSQQGGIRQLEQPKVSTPPAAEPSPHKSGFFGFGNKSKSSNKLQHKDERRPATRDQLQSRDNAFQLQSSATVADISRDSRPRDVRPQTSDNNLNQSKTEPQFNRLQDGSLESRPLQNNPTVAPKKNKPKGINFLRRTNSTRNELEVPDDGRLQPTTQEQDYQEGIRTAPLREDQDATFREALKDSSNRNHSADRQRHEKPEQQKSEYGRRVKETHRPNQGSVSLPREASTSLMNHLKGAGNKARGLFGKSEKREDPVETFVPKLVNLPLIEQTRITRISKTLETSRDKTEYWMPALPWRCIDYLNYRGTDQEGLYRVPGGGVEIKKYHKKFDDELDVDLFQERDLYDINIIGSLLKQWLRELPDELFPKEAQNRVARACGPEPTEVPQILIDELSNLPPYNYYLLFALTCHLSLILEHCEKNKMSMMNLTICILPCMKMDATCFKLLVEHWRDCWKGCATEGEWMEKEIKWREGEQADLRAPGPFGMRKGSVAQGSTHERNLSSNSDSRPATAKTTSNERSRNVSRENNNVDGRQGSNGCNNGNNERSERLNGGSSNNSGADRNGSGQNSHSSSRERPQQQSQSRLRGGALEQAPARLQTPPEVYVPAGKNGRHDQLLDPIQPMSPMHMGNK